MRIAVVTFPGSNCEQDAVYVLSTLLGQEVVRLDHRERELGRVDAVVLPGGFSYGDYLRPGAIARGAPILDEVAAFAARGGPVVGICNGFQVLTEAELLPGALLRNASRRFVCKTVGLRVENARSAFTRKYAEGEEIQLPVAHHDGCYYADAETLARLEGEGQIAFRYLDDVNGSVGRIAGVVNEKGNVLGLMPHPERAAESLLGSDDGRRLFESML